MLCFLAGCGTAGSHLVPGSTGESIGESVTRADFTRSGNIFLSDSNAVQICPTLDILREPFACPPGAGSLQDVSLPVQIAVDQKGTVYVANAQTDSSGDGAVTIYRRGETSPSRVLTAGLNTTTGVAVDSAGTVYASNKFLASVVVFPKGRTVPSATITGGLVGPDGLAVDGKDDLFIADSSANEVFEVPSGSRTPQSLQLQDLDRPVGVAVDSQGNLFVSNLFGRSSNVAVYPPGSAKPSATFIVPGPVTSGSKTVGQPVMLSITTGGVLIATAFYYTGPWPIFGFGNVDGFRPGRSKPAWVTSGTAMDSPYGAAFQPAN
jgi:hypothetical protein